MKQMTKEELIEYFIEQLGDNEILGQVMSIEQIRDKLNYMINFVTYNPEKGGFSASWNPQNEGGGSLNFDRNKILSLSDEKTNIVHELLHVLSTTNYSDMNSKMRFQKCGLFFHGKFGVSQLGWNRAINEGMTDTLAEQITGEYHNGYNDEKSFYRVLSVILGEDAMLKTFFSDIDKTYCKSASDIERKATNIFKENILEKYGLELGIEINDDIKKVLSLADQLNDLNSKDGIYGLNENGKRIQSETRQEISNTLLKLLEKVLDNEPDIMRKIDIMTKCFLTQFRGEISEKVLKELLAKNDIDDIKKLEILQQVRQAKWAFIPKQVLEQILFNPSSDLNLKAEDKLKNYLALWTNNYKESRDIDRMYDLYAESGKMSEEKFPKRDIFARVVDGVKDKRLNSIQEIDAEINKIKYRQIGEYYETLGDYKIGDRIFDNNGNEVRREYIFIKKTEEVSLEKLGALDLESNQATKVLCDNIIQVFEQYKAINPRKLGSKSIEFIGKNMLKLKYGNYGEKSYCSYYSINDDGSIEELEIGEERRLTDDMSRIELAEKFDEMDLSSSTFEEKVSEYFFMYSGCEDWIEPDKVYEWYVENGGIIPSATFKKGVFRQNFIGDKQKLDKRLSNIKYRLIGEYYQIFETNKSNDTMFDTYGHIVNAESIWFDPFEDERIEDDSDIELLQNFLQPGKINVLSEQIKDIVLDMRAKYPTNADEEHCFLRAFGKLLEIGIYYTDNQSTKGYYKMQPDATLETVEIRRRKKIYR